MKKKFLASTIMFSLVLGLLGMASVSSAQVATISAGSNQSITLPANTVTLNGTATPSVGSLIAGYSWSQTSGPVASVIATPTLASTSVSGLSTAGNYVFTFTASDNTAPVALTNSATVMVTVNPAIVNPVVNAGVDQSITLPTSTVILVGSAQVAVGRTITGYNWSQTSGPNTSVIATSTNASTAVSGLIAGTYVYTLTATDSTSATGSDSVTITVGTATPLPPVKNLKSKLEINQNGQVNLQGTLEAINGSVLTVKVWGLTFVVNTANSKFDGRVKDLSMYKVGDYVTVKGKMDSSASTPTINARSVKNMSIQTLKENRDREESKKNEDKEKKDDDNKSKNSNSSKGNNRGEKEDR